MYRGVVGYCTACGKARPPLVTSSVSLAGQGARVGGVVARSVGWVVLAVGILISAMIAGFFQWLIPAGMVGWILGAMGTLVSGFIGGGLVMSGKKLGSSGVDAQRFAREKAVLALAGTRGGTITAVDASRALDMPVEAASEFLTSLAKRVPDEVRVDLDDQGALLYTFVHAVLDGPRLRVDNATSLGNAKPGASASAGQADVRVQTNAQRNAPVDPIDAEFAALEEQERAAEQAAARGRR